MGRLSVCLRIAFLSIAEELVRGHGLGLWVFDS